MQAKMNPFTFAYATAKDLNAEVDDEGVMYLPVLIVYTASNEEGQDICQVIFSHPTDGFAVGHVPVENLINAQEWIFNAYMTREEFGDDLDEMHIEGEPVEGKARFFRLITGPEYKDFNEVEARYAP